MSVYSVVLRLMALYLVNLQRTEDEHLLESVDRLDRWPLQQIPATIFVPV